MAVELDKLAGPDGGDKSRRLAAFWQDQLNSIKDSPDYKRWYKRGEGIEKRYRDERNRTDDDSGYRRYNALWSNVEILKPALYGRTPLPVAERRFHDKDPVGRAASQMLERALRNEIEICGYDEALTRAVSDYLLPGRGTVWVRYEPQIEESVSLPIDPQTDMRDAQGELEEDEEGGDEVTPMGRVRPSIPPENSGTEGEDEVEPSTDEHEDEEEKLEDTGDRIVRESTPVDYISWMDFITFPARARTWKEVTAVGKRVYMSRDQMIKRFGRKIGKDVPLSKDDRGHKDQGTTHESQMGDKGQVFEIWNKEDMSVYWVAEGYEFLLDRKDDPLGLDDFFPTPRPLYSNPTNNTLVPVPDYLEYQDQAAQIDDLTQRISMLTKACKMTGLYNAAQKDIQRVFQESVENELIPVDDWAAFAEGGGIEGNWSLMPVKEIIGIINELQQCKQQQIEEMDRLTGINDIMRGTSDARETLGGVRLKVNSTGTRLTSRQNEVARFARDTVRIMAEIMSEHFSPQSLIEASGALYAEGLGPSDMPDLTTLQSGGPSAQNQQGMPGQPPGPPQGMPRPPQMPMGAPPQAGGMGQPTPSPMGQQPPMAPPQPGMPPQGMPPGGNVVPFKPPMPPQQPGMAPGMPPQGMPPQAPPIPPEELKKIQAIKKIAQAILLLRDEKTRGFRVDIEVDSTIFPDIAQEKQDRTEFLTAISQFMQTSMGIGAQVPEAIPLMAKLLQFGVRGYRVGRDLESAIEEFSDQSVQMAKNLIEKRNSTPNPEMIKAQNEQMKGKVQLMTAQSKVESDKMTAQAEIQRQALENQGEQANAAIDLQSNQMDLKMKEIDQQIEMLKLAMEQIRVEREKNKPAPTAANPQG